MPHYRQSVTGQLRQNIGMYVQDLGADPSGVKESSSQVINAISLAESLGCPVDFGYGTYKISQPLNVDTSKTSLQGENAFLDFSGMPSGDTAITVTNSGDYIHFYKEQKPVIRGLVISGQAPGIQGTLSNTTGLVLGSVSSYAVSLFTVAQFVIQGFATNISFANNSWRIALQNGQVRWGNFVYPSGLSNSGECMVAHNVSFADGGTTLQISGGEWHFNNCSFDNAEMDITGGVIKCNGCHFEKPGITAPTNSYVRISTAPNALCILRDCTIIGGYSDFTKFPFYVDDAVTQGGFIFDGCDFANTSSYSMSAEARTDAILFKNSWLGGKGRVQFQNNESQFMPSPSNPSVVNTSYSANRVTNGNLDSTYIPITQIVGAAQPAAVIITDATSPTGKAFQVTNASLSTQVMWKFTAPVVPGEVISMAVIYELAGMLAGDTFACQIEFYDPNNTALSPSYNLYFSSSANTSGYVRHDMGSIVVPEGVNAIAVWFQITTGSSSGTRTMNIAQAFICGL